MYSKVKVGQNEVPMLCLASIDIYFQHIFHEDPVKVQADHGDDAGVMIGFYQRMGFVMSKFAELKDRKEMFKLNEESYVEWLEDFERNDLLGALEEIRATYEGQTVTSVDAKKNSDA